MLQALINTVPIWMEVLDINLCSNQTSNIEPWKVFISWHSIICGFKRQTVCWLNYFKTFHWLLRVILDALQFYCKKKYFFENELIQKTKQVNCRWIDWFRMSDWSGTNVTVASTYKKNHNCDLFIAVLEFRNFGPKKQYFLLNRCWCYNLKSINVSGYRVKLTV